MNKRLDSRGLRGFVKSFKYAFSGIIFCIRNERNMRVHLFSALCVILFSVKFGLSPLEYAILFIATGLVVVCEMINSAIETVVDLHTGSYNRLAKAAKDIAAGAVLISALISVGVGFVLFFKFPKLCDVLFSIATDIFCLVIILVLVITGYIFIFAEFWFRNKNGE